MTIKQLFVKIFVLNSILPPSASKHLRALEQAAYAMLKEVSNSKIPIRDLWNFNKCPVALLPWLAWTMSVEEWDSTWPEKIKRNTIGESAKVHRKKGTLSSIYRIINAVGITATVIEWWQQQPLAAPYTFIIEVIVHQNEILQKQSTIGQLKALVNSTKPARAHYKVVLIVQKKAKLNVIGLLQADKVVEIKMVAKCPN